MANMHFLHDIEIKRNSTAYFEMLQSPILESMLQLKAMEVLRLYQGKVGKKTGKLMASADASTAIGGHDHDRWVGKVTIADESVYAEELWHGEKFYYGVFHEEGTKKKGRRRRRKYGSEGFHELRQVAQEWRNA